MLIFREIFIYKIDHYYSFKPRRIKLYLLYKYEKNECYFKSA